MKKDEKIAFRKNVVEDLNSSTSSGILRTQFTPITKKRDADASRSFVGAGKKATPLEPDGNVTSVKGLTLTYNMEK